MAAVTVGSVQLRANGLGHLLAEGRGAGLVAPGVPGGLLGQHPHDGRDLRVARHRDLELEA